MGLLSCISQKEVDDLTEKNENLGLKIYICGELPQKDEIIESLFKASITNENYINSGTHEFKTDQFYWIARKYDELSEQTIESICNEIKNDIIRIAQSYRDYYSKEKYSINDDEVMLISSRDMERDIPLIANNGIAKVMEWEHNGDIYKYKEDNTYLRNLCKSTLLDKLLLDINEKVVKLGNM